ncbi:MAG: heme o synthase [Chloroflexota bacterium]|nr:heme o synthase [Chloroflexota bacterium]
MARGLAAYVRGIARLADTPGRPFRYLTIATVVAIFALIVVGGTVRVTESGLGCPDWPLCHGRLIPPMEFQTIIEYSHRLTATAVSILVVATSLLAVLRYRKQRWIVGPAVAGLALLLLQVVLGGITVLTELSPALLVAHLAVAQVFFASYVVVAVVSHHRGHTSDVLKGERPFSAWYAWLAVAMAALLYLVLLSGSYVAASGASAACLDWPLCNGRLFPGGGTQGIHMFHRYMVALSSVMVAGVVVATWRGGGRSAGLRWTSALLGVALVAQVMVGASVVWFGFPAALRGLHLSTATVVWGLALLLAVLAVRSGRAAQVPVEAGVQKERAGFRAVAGDYVKLTKPKIVLLLLVTALGGMMLANGGVPGMRVLLVTLAGVGMAAGGANSINQYLERDIDGRMSRTRLRPIPSQRLAGRDALVLGIGLNVLAFIALSLWVNPLSAALTLTGTLVYVMVYTLWLKRSTAQNIVIGGSAGAIPPLVGWAAVTGSVGLPAWYLFAIVFFWTPPHFWALALLLQRDYAAAGVPMLPVVYGAQETRRHILLYSLVLAGVTLMMVGTGVVGWTYLASAMALNAGMVYYSLRLIREGSVPAARRLYLYSLAYLALLFLALIVDSLVA